MLIWGMEQDDTPATPPDSDHLGFAWDIAMALRNVGLYWGRGRRLEHADRIGLGKRILEHLHMSGVELTRRPPTPGYGASSLVELPVAPKDGKNPGNGGID